MAKKPSNTNPLLGEVQCQDCGGPEYVYQSKRRGNYLYGRCPECGINQKTGKAAQARLAAYVPVGSLGASEAVQTPDPMPTPTPTQTGRKEVTTNAPDDDLYTDGPVTVQTEPETDDEPAPVAVVTEPDRKPGGVFGLIFGLVLVLLPALFAMR